MHANGRSTTPAAEGARPVARRIPARDAAGEHADGARVATMVLDGRVGHSTARRLRQEAVLQRQLAAGNALVQRMLAGDVVMRCGCGGTGGKCSCGDNERRQDSK